jgi:hypothetical protein
MAKIKIILICLFWLIPAIHSYSNIGHDYDCVVNYSSSFLGAEEVGGNNKGFDDPFLEKMLRKTGWKPKLPWCSFYVQGLLDHCDIPNTITGWSPSSYNKNDVIYTDGEFQDVYSDKDVMVMSLSYDKFKNDKSRYKAIGHTGIVVHIGAHSVVTMEGNTNDLGTRDSRAGDGVYKKKRPLNKKLHITRWKKING